MELIHVATLVHDDVVDNAQMRRGVNATAVDYGNRVSVLAGDYLFAWIFKNVTMHYPPRCARALGNASRHLRRRGAATPGARQSRSSPRALCRNRAKENRLAFCSFRALRRRHGRRRAADGRGARAFGEAFGIAFQMRDDLLDVTADERSMGKPAANDLTEHKTTLPLIAALAAGGPDFRGGGRLLRPAERRDPGCRAAGIERTGGVAETQAEIAGYAEKAKRALEPTADGAAKRELARLTNALLS